MKFGKRSDSDDAGADSPGARDPFAPPPAEPPPPPLPPTPESAPLPPLPPVPDSPPPVAEHEVPGAAGPSAASDPAAEDELPVVQVEPVVEGEAYEVFADEPTGPPETLTVEHHEPMPAPPPPATHQPASMPFPVAEQPISVVTPGPGPAPVTTLGDSGEAFASGHAAAPGPSWQEPVMEIANERPEFVVAAAFAGGLLAAMILRRLGN